MGMEQKWVTEYYNVTYHLHIFIHSHSVIVTFGSDLVCGVWGHGQVLFETEEDVQGSGCRHLLQLHLGISWPKFCPRCGQAAGKRNWKSQKARRFVPFQPRSKAVPKRFLSGSFAFHVSCPWPRLSQRSRRWTRRTSKEGRLGSDLESRTNCTVSSDCTDS